MHNSALCYTPKLRINKQADSPSMIKIQHDFTNAVIGNQSYISVYGGSIRIHYQIWL